MSDALSSALAFSPDDLDANRQGSLSEMQHYRLRVRRRRSIATGLMILMAAVLISTLLLFFGSRGSAILSLIGIGTTLCSAAIVGIFTRYWMRLGADIQTRQVSASSGELERIIKPVTRRVVNYMIRLDQSEVFVSKEAFDAFHHLRSYTIYRARYTGILLSAEPADV
jgi:hypothetical protein